MLKITDVVENEEKYLPKSFRKEEPWEREFIIYQWYEAKERKLKVIFDLSALSVKAVRVIKSRADNRLCKKEIQYLNIEEINFQKQLGLPFVAKRRAVAGDVCLDHFLRSNKTCEYLVEIENGLPPDHLPSGLLVGINVTDDLRYRNETMCIPFQREHLDEFLLLYDCIPGWKKPAAETEPVNR